MKSAYARTTITVPAELKQRMKSGGTGVNWSAVACAAFQQKLEERKPVTEVTSIEGAVQRMKAIRQPSIETQERAISDGIAKGKQWALNLATPEQLRQLEGLKGIIFDRGDTEWRDFLSNPAGRQRLAQCVASGSNEWAGIPEFQLNLDLAKGDSPGHDGRLVEQRRGESHGQGKRPQWSEQLKPSHELSGVLPDVVGWEVRVWRSVLTDHPVHPCYFFGFAEGALQVWVQLKAKI